MAAGCSETFWTKTPPAVGVAAAAALAEGSTVTVTVTMSVTHWTSRARLSRGMAETSRAPAAKRTAEYFILNDGIVFAWSCRCQVELAKEMELAFSGFYTRHVFQMETMAIEYPPDFESIKLDI